MHNLLEYWTTLNTLGQLIHTKIPLMGLITVQMPYISKKFQLNTDALHLSLIYSVIALSS